MNESGTTHQFLLPDSHPDVDDAPPLPVEVNVNDAGVTINARDAEGFYSCDVFLEHYDGKLILHVAGADNPDAHAHHLVLGVVRDGELEPIQPAPDLHR